MQYVRSPRADHFARAFKIPWAQAAVRGCGLDITNWRYTVDQARQNIQKVFEDMAPADTTTPKGWIAKYMTAAGRQSPFGGGKYGAVPRVCAQSEDDVPDDLGEEAHRYTDQPRYAGSARRTAGNAAVGLFLLIRLSYISAFNLEPRSPAFVTIWQEMDPA